MSGGFFDQQDEEGEFRDMPDEVGGGQPPPVSAPSPRRTGGVLLPPQPQVYAPVTEEDEYEDIDMDIDSNEDDDYSQVLNDAGLRLEQGNLYKLIMNHDIFEGVEADPIAVKAVTRQIRKFAKEQMEIMLGMRKETSKIERLEIDFPFNQVEVETLRKLAHVASKGASSNSDNFVPEIRRTTEEVEHVQTKRREGLNRISAAPKAVRPMARVEAPVRRSEPVKKAPPQPLQQKAQAPVKRKPIAREAADVLASEGLTMDEIDAQYEPGYKPIQKPLHELTPQELLDRNRETSSRRHKTVKNPSAIPMPSYEMESMLHHQRVMESTGSGAVSTIMAAMNNQKK